MTNNKWQMYRAGILNYWYYDEAEFDFSDGRLLLRGSNGSGKSVTMQSLITVLLDGVKSADRLDSFGSRSRRIEDYLLGEKEISNYDERTGYLFLEYKRENTEQYITTGIGLHARRGGSKVDFWGFVITDGRRINKDIYLYKSEKNPQTGEKQRIPLSKRELENRIGSGGRLTVSQNEYMQMVNRYIFGFKDIEKYQELMRLLIQLRSPKLSRDFKPSVVYEILNASLPSLSDDELRPLSETIESMEKTKLSIEQLGREKKSFDGICKHYDAYNTAALAQKAALKKGYNQQVNILTDKIKSYEQQKEDAENALQNSSEQQKQLEIEQGNLSRENEELKNNEIYKAAANKKEQDDLLKKQEEKYKKLDESLKNKKRREFELSDEIEKYQGKMDETAVKAADILDELCEMAESADFAADGIMRAKFDIANEDNNVHFIAWQQELKNYINHLQELRKIALEYKTLADNNQQIEYELGQENKLLDEYRLRYKKILRSLEEQRDKLVKNYYEWQEKYRELLPFDQDDQSKVVGVLQNLYSNTEWREAADVLDKNYAEQTQQVNARIGIVNADLKTAENKEKELRQELKDLQEMQEAVPPIEEEYKTAQEYLRNEKMPFTAFYEAVEFRDTVEKEERCSIEAALINVGVLDALILAHDDDSSKLPAAMRGAVMFSKPAPLLTATLFDYLKPTAGLAIDEQRISDILSSIIVDDGFYNLPNDGYISINIQNGAYAYANIAGCSAAREDALYIGRQARKAYRQKQILQKQQELQLISEEIENIYGSLGKLKDKVACMAEARQEFPTEKEIQAVHRKEQEVQSDIERQQQRVNDKDEKKKNIILQMRQIQQNVNQLRGSSRLSFEADTYENAVKDMTQYNMYLSELRLCQKDYDNTNHNRKRMQADIEYVKAETDELNGSLLEFEIDIKKIRERLKTLEEYLQQMDAAGLEQRISIVMARLKQIPEEINRQVSLYARNQNIIENINIGLAGIREENEFYKFLYNESSRLFTEEIEKGLIFASTPEEAQLKEVQLKWEKAGTPSLNELATKLNGQFFKEQSILTEYRMQLNEAESVINDAPNIINSELVGRLTKEWDNLKEKAKRQIIVIESGGRFISPYQQLEEIKQHLAEQENLLSEQDKKLYEEIIMNNIGRVISQRIYAAEHWIGQMNALMQKSDTSSGLKFHLEWKPLKGEDDDELDTSELVELLHMDPTLLKDEDMKKIVLHFSARIERAKEEAELKEKDMEFFQTAIRDLLDYRKWFRFRLFYDQGEQIKRRELTDKIFFRFSGGEKAMAMYIPLFSAAYSRYMEAGSDAPFVITLDEAFAGVDEKNIRDMFNLVEKLHFNYIMNSQALWGDYDVVPSLNIYELLRPANAPYVSTVQYHWNGSIRKVVLANDEDEVSSNA